jgi:hypothetical protein
MTTQDNEIQNDEEAVNATTEEVNSESINSEETVVVAAPVETAPEEEKIDLTADLEAVGESVVKLVTDVYETIEHSVVGESA